ncbi:MAG: hypothetical protein DI603_19610 [Roseateles depolymerans]|uniref:PepSY domain-containing protein n=1 Tax=Roseateles depolymerans TaxID=76731 RepID=A0A2W5DDA2_9BURK|nr:MAG: hypothetical protein DI603_19610 [Roseateles depolymerans]
MMRKPLTLLHRWVGLVAGLVLALLGLTGSLMVWQAPLDAALNPQWFSAPAQACPAPPRPVERTLALLAEHAPQARAQTVVAPREPGAAYQVWERREAASGQRREHFIDPACGLYLGQRDRGALRLDAAHAVPLLYELHSRLLSGDTGHEIAGITALLFTGLTLTGLWLAWPPAARGRRLRAWRQALSVSTAGPPTRRWYELHRAAGLWLTPLALLVSLTGAALVFQTPVRDAIAAVLPVQRLAKLPGSKGAKAGKAGPADTRPAPAQDPAPAASAPDEWLAVAQQQFPTARWSRLTLPTSNQGLAEVRLLQPGELRAATGFTRVRLDRQGQVRERYDPLQAPSGSQLIDAVFPLHSAEPFGLAIRLLWSAFGLLPATLLATGAWLWWRRQRRRHAASAAPVTTAAGRVG